MFDAAEADVEGAEVKIAFRAVVGVRAATGIVMTSATAAAVRGMRRLLKITYFHPKAADTTLRRVCRL